MAKPLLAIGCEGAFSLDYPLSQKIDSSGNPYLHGNRVYLGRNTSNVWGIVLGDDGSQYCASDLKYYTDTESLSAYSEYAMTTRKFNQDGDLLWYANHGAACFGIAIDDSENIYVYGDAVNSSGVVRTTPGATGYYNLRKYNSSGALQWSTDTGYSTPHLDNPYPRPIVYRSGYIYVGGTAFPYTENILVKIDASDGSIIWSACNEFNSAIRGIAVDSSGNVFIAGFFWNSGAVQAVRKYNSSGSFVAGAIGPVNDSSYNSQGTGIVELSSGNFAVSMTPVSLSGTYYVFYEYDSSLNFITKDSGFGNYTLSAIGIDSDDTIYGVRVVPSGGSSGPAARTVFGIVGYAIDWQATTFGTNTADVAGNALGALCLSVREVQTPALRLPINLGTPTIAGMVYVSPPGLALGLSLGIPTITRYYVGLPVPVIHRLVFDDDASISIKIKSIQLRISETTTSATYVCEIPDAESLTAILDQIGHFITIWRGVRFNDGIEQIDPWISVNLSGASVDRGSKNASITLYGESTTIYNHNTIAIKNAAYRNDRNGERRIRCDVDIYLRPNDIADLGNGETFTVNEITIFIDKSSSVMEVSE